MDWNKRYLQELKMVGAVCVTYGYHDANKKLRLWKELSELKENMGVFYLRSGVVRGIILLEEDSMAIWYILWLQL